MRAANGNIVTADNGGAAAMIANRTAIGPWGGFDLIHDYPKKVGFAP